MPTICNGIIDKEINLHNDYIISQIESDRSLALRLENAVKGVSENLAKQMSQIGSGVTRLSWYTSCLTDNYLDVCSKLKDEDVRFLLGLREIYKRQSIAVDIIQIYVEHEIKNLNSHGRDKIIKELSGYGSRIASNFGLSNGISLSIALAVTRGLNISGFHVGKWTAIPVMATGLYGVVQDAAESAGRLKMLNPLFYHVLYTKKLEMMYFIVEPVLGHVIKDSFFDENTIIKNLKHLLTMSGNM